MSTLQNKAIYVTLADTKHLLYLKIQVFVRVSCFAIFVQDVPEILSSILRVQYNMAETTKSFKFRFLILFHCYSPESTNRSFCMALNHFFCSSLQELSI